MNSTLKTIVDPYKDELGKVARDLDKMLHYKGETDVSTMGVERRKNELFSSYISCR